MQVNIGAMTWEPVLAAVPYEREDLPVVTLTDEEHEKIALAFEAFEVIQGMLWDKVEEWKASQPIEVE